MKSPMVSKLFPSEVNNYSDLKVMHSPAGYYVGTEYSCEGWIEAGSRDSGYFKTKDEAEAFLKQLEAGNATPRMNP